MSQESDTESQAGENLSMTVPSSSTSSFATSQPQLYATRAGRKKVSWIWQHGHVAGKGRDSRWVCKHCIGISTSILAEGGGNILKHLAKHKIFEPKKENSPLGMALADENNLPMPHSSQQTILSCTSSRKVNPHILKRLVVEWIVDRHHAFLEVEATGFRNIIQY